MISALDSSVILDVLTADTQFAGASESTLRRASREGSLVVCECVLAEVFPVLGAEELMARFMSDWQLTFLPSTLESALLAGRHFETYLTRGGRAGRVVVDFLIGAHAALQADRLVARDRGFLRDYFTELEVLAPT